MPVAVDGQKGHTPDARHPFVSTEKRKKQNTAPSLSLVSVPLLKRASKFTQGGASK